MPGICDSSQTVVIGNDSTAPTRLFTGVLQSALLGPFPFSLSTSPLLPYPPPSQSLSKLIEGTFTTFRHLSSLLHAYTCAWPAWMSDDLVDIIFIPQSVSCHRIGTYITTEGLFLFCLEADLRRVVSAPLDNIHCMGLWDVTVAFWLFPSEIFENDRQSDIQKWFRKKTPVR